jgi:hypothetical protein
MGLDFAVFSCGRSGSTWTAAWLSRYAAVLHDPAATQTLADLDMWAEDTEGPAGISCTVGWLQGWAYELEKRNVPIVKLVRESEAINRSFERVGLPRLPPIVFEEFKGQPGITVHIKNLTISPLRAEFVLDHLIPSVEFDVVHWDEFRRMNIQPTEEVLKQVRRLVRQHSTHEGDEE